MNNTTQVHVRIESIDFLEAIKAYENCLAAIEREISYIEYLNRTDKYHFTNNPISALKSVKSYVESCKNSITKLNN